MIERGAERRVKWWRHLCAALAAAHNARFLNAPRAFFGMVAGMAAGASQPPLLHAASAAALPLLTTRCLPLPRTHAHCLRLPSLHCLPLPACLLPPLLHCGGRRWSVVDGRGYSSGGRHAARVVIGRAHGARCFRSHDITPAHANAPAQTDRSSARCHFCLRSRCARGV